MSVVDVRCIDCQPRLFDELLGQAGGTRRFLVTGTRSGDAAADAAAEASRDCPLAFPPGSLQRGRTVAIEVEPGVFYVTVLFTYDPDSQPD